MASDNEVRHLVALTAPSTPSVTVKGSSVNFTVLERETTCNWDVTVSYCFCPVLEGAQRVPRIFLIKRMVPDKI